MTTAANERAFGWYLTLVSLLFGCFVASWLTTWRTITPNYYSLETWIGGSVLVVLMCLWWWYAIFLGRIAPAKSFVAYIWDFITLGIFAYGASVWNDVQVFIYTLAIALLLMGIRVYSATRAVTRNSLESKALTHARGILLFSFLILFGALIIHSAEIYKIKLEWLIIVILAIGMIITLYAGSITGGLIIQVPLSSTQQYPKLKLILAHLPKSITEQDIEALVQCATSQKYKFGNELIKRYGSNASYHISKIHNIYDTDVQAILSALNSIKRPEVIKAKGFWVYFCHWFDDIFDAYPRIIPINHIKQLIESEKIQFSNTKLLLNGNIKSTIDYILRVRSIFKFLDDLIEETKNLFIPNELLNTGIKRIILGSLIFDKTHKEYARRQHRAILKKALGENKCRSIYETFDEEYISLTTKVCFELWMGFEFVNHNNDNFYDTFIYSLLYGPLIYYQNNEEEVETGEIENTAPLQAPTSARNITKAGDLLVAQTINHLKSDNEFKRQNVELRLWQLRSAIHSCTSVLPDQVICSYNTVAKKLENILLQT